MMLLEMLQSLRAGRTLYQDPATADGDDRKRWTLLESTGLVAVTSDGGVNEMRWTAFGISGGDLADRLTNAAIGATKEPSNNVE